MGETTGIQWTDATWNPWRGCTKISQGCKNCYMYTEQNRYGNDPSVVTRTKTWGDPYKWNKQAAAEGVRRLVFTCSWSDVLHEAADEWRPEFWKVIRETQNLTYQILTKRPERFSVCLPDDWGNGYPNVWLGVSVENRDYLSRIDALRQTPAAVRFLSLEPLLGDLGTLDLTGIHWVIVGGESGPKARPMQIEWAIDIVRQCRAAGVPCFVKQLGGHPNKRHDMTQWTDELRVRELPRADRVLDGRTWEEMP